MVAVQHETEAVIFLGVLTAWFVIRAPYELRARRGRQAVDRNNGTDGSLLLVALLSMVVVPLGLPLFPLARRRRLQTFQTGVSELV